MSLSWYVPPKDSGPAILMSLEESWTSILCPSNGLHVWAIAFLEILAVIYAWVDEEEKAIDILEQLMESYYVSGISIWNLKKVMRWDPLRDNPRFQQLIEKYAEVES